MSEVFDGALREPAPAKLNLALHVRGKRADGRHDIETIFAFCTDGDTLTLEPADHSIYELRTTGPFCRDLGPQNIVTTAYFALKRACGNEHAEDGVILTLDKRLPVASGIGGGSADAAAALRLLTRFWNIDPAHAVSVAPSLGSDVPACLLSLTARGEGAGDALAIVDDPRIGGRAVLLVNPGVALSTGAVFAAWDGEDRGALGDWAEGRNDLEAPARALVPQIGDVLDWLADQDGAEFVRMSGSGATCFALFLDEGARDVAAAACPTNWWHLATFLR